MSSPLQQQQQQQQLQQQPSPDFHQHHHYQQQQIGIGSNNDNDLLEENDEDDEFVEISREDAIQILLVDNEIADIQLRGTDNLLIPANKGMLAARSSVFRRMLFGNFQESTSTIITVHYPSYVIYAVIEYIYNDTINSIFQHKQQRSNNNNTNEADKEQQTIVLEGGGGGSGGGDRRKGRNTSASSSTATGCGSSNLPFTIIALGDAANYYGLPGLRRKAEALARTLTEQNSLLAVSFLSACNHQSHGTGGTDDDDDDVLLSSELSLSTTPSMVVVEEYCLHVLRSHAREILNGGGQISSLSVSQLEKLLQDDKIQADELTLFQMIQSWVKDDDNDDDDDDDDDREEDEEEEDTKEGSHNVIKMMKGYDGNGGGKRYHHPCRRRRQQQEQQRKYYAKQLTQHIRLDKIDAADLKETVKPSGLVSLEQLCTAYEVQAISASTKHGKISNRDRSCSHSWNVGSGDVFVSTGSNYYQEAKLECYGMKQGIHRWSIYVIDDTTVRPIWLGISLSHNNNINNLTTSSPTPSSSSSSSSSSFGSEQEGWIYGSRGFARQNGDIVQPQQQQSSGSLSLLSEMNHHHHPRLPPYTSGSIVTFTLDLLPGQPYGGALSASVNGGSSFLLFSNLLRAAAVAAAVTPVVVTGTVLDDKDHDTTYTTTAASTTGNNNNNNVFGGGGFVPAAFMWKPGTVQFLGFEKV